MFVSLAPFQALGATIAKDEYGGAGTFGLLGSVFGGGMLVGAVVASRWRPRHPIRAGCLVALPWPVSISLFGLGWPVPVVAVAFAMTGLGLSLFGVVWSTTLAERIPSQLLSRVTAYDYMGSTALLPLGYLASGPAAAVVGAGNVAAVGGAIGLVAMVAVLVVPEVWNLRR